MNTSTVRSESSSCTCIVVLCGVMLLFAPLSQAQIYIGSGLFTAKVAKYSTSGAVINPSLITGLSYPTGLALDGQGSLYVVDRNNNSIGKYTESGGVINSSLFTYSTPSGIAYDGQGHLYVGRTDPGSVGEFSASTGAPINVPFATGLFNPDGVAVYDGKVYALESNAIYIYNTAGTLLNTIAASTPWGICFDDAGHMFVPVQGYGRIAEYTTSGTLITSNLITGLSYPVYTGFDGQNLYVAELNNGNSRIGKYTTSGVPINPNLITGIDHFDTMVVAPEPSFGAFGLLCFAAWQLLGRNQTRLRV